MRACLAAFGEVFGLVAKIDAGCPPPSPPIPSPRSGEGSRAAGERAGMAPGVALRVSRQKLGTEYRGQNRRLKTISVARPFGRNLCYPWVVHWQNALLEVFNPSRCAHRNKAARSNPHTFVQLRRCHAPVEETKLACVFHLACSVEQTRHGRAIE